MSCFLEDPLCPRSPVVVWVCCVVVWCVGAVCVQNFRGCVQSLGAPPTPLRRTPPRLHRPPPDPPPPDPSLPKWGFTRQPENSKRAHLRVPAFNHTTKIPRNDPQERKRKNENCGGRGKKKRENLGLPPFGAPTFGAPLFLSLGLHPSTLHPSGPTVRGTTLRDTSLRGPSAGLPLRRTALTVSGLLFVLFCS